MDNVNLTNFKNCNRIMLKLSGEVLMGEQKYGIDSNKVIAIAEDIINVFNKKNNYA